MMQMKIKRLSILGFIILLLLYPLWAYTPPKRIVSLAPNITEMLFRIGAGALLIGRTEFCVYPEAAKQIPSVGGYLNPDYEMIVSLEPDIIFLLPNMEMERTLQRLGLKTFTLPNETIDEIYQGFRALGRVLYRSGQAEAVIRGIQDTLQFVRQEAAERNTLSAVLVVGREAGSLKGLYAAGEDTYLSEILSFCGGVNIFADAPARYFDVSKEELIQRNPDAIIEFRLIENIDPSEETLRLKADWNALLTLKAVQKDHVFILSDRAFLIPGPRISLLAVALNRVLQKAGQ
jgi:iron complex transport system substrate-binding protein